MASYIFTYHGTYLDHILIFHPLLDKMNETFQTCKWLMNKPLIEFSSGLSVLCFCEIRYRLWICEAQQYPVTIVDSWDWIPTSTFIFLFKYLHSSRWKSNGMNIASNFWCANVSHLRKYMTYCFQTCWGPWPQIWICSSPPDLSPMPVREKGETMRITFLEKHNLRILTDH